MIVSSTLVTPTECIHRQWDPSTGWRTACSKGELQKKAGEIEREGRREEGVDEPASR